jgi:arabinan endo-1,5-alpha-L-arabinosidase
VTVPTTGDAYNFVQGGVVIYGDDGHYVKLASASIYETRQTEFGKQDSSQPAGSPTYGNGVVGPVGTWTWLRITKHRVGGHDAYTASTSVDGRHWRTGITWTANLGAHAKIGLISMGGSGFTSLFDRVKVSRVR